MYEIQKIYKEVYKYEDFVIQTNQKGYWEKRLKVNMEELQTINHNHIKIPINSVIWDVDCHLRVISDKIHDFISSNLIKDNISHQVWDTSRSPHIHAFFKDMNLYSQEVRRDIRLLILKYYSGKYFNWIDKSKASENNMIRDFGGMHEITGKPKTLIYEFKGTSPINPLIPVILEQLRVLHQQRNEVPETAPIEPTGEYLKGLQMFLDYCLEHQHTHDGRERILFRELAKMCILLNYDTNQRTRIYHKIIQNCKGRHISEIINWDKFMQKQKSLKINFKELKQYGFYKDDLFSYMKSESILSKEGNGIMQGFHL